MGKKYKTKKLRIYAKLFHSYHSIKYLSIAQLAKYAKCSRGYVFQLLKEIRYYFSLSFITKNNVRYYRINSDCLDYIKKLLKETNLGLV